MEEKQIQPAREYRLAQQSRPRGLISQMSMALLQPAAFYRTLPAQSRQWLWVALLILALTGYIAVRQTADSGGGSINPAPVTDFSGPMPSGAPFSEVPPDSSFGGPPIIDAGNTGGSASSGGEVSSTWTTALVAASGFIAIWGVQAVLLSEVSLFNGRAPDLGRNFQIAVWASLPLALMGLVQLAYYSAGGAVGQPGLTGLLVDWDGFAALSPLMQALLTSLAMRFTLFWLWSLILLYFGARYGLRGRGWSSVLVVILWSVVIVVVPVVTGAVEMPTTEEAIPPADDFTIPGDDETLPGLGGLNFGEQGEASTEGEAVEQPEEMGQQGIPVPIRPGGGG